MRRVDGLFGRWLLATAGGWLLGFVLVLILAEIWSVTGGEAQFPVGIGMGAGVGYLQARTIDAIIDSPRQWLSSSIVGMAIPFAAWDVTTWIGVGTPYALQVATLFGAVIVGILQALLLRQRGKRAIWWIPACIVGWGVPAGLAALQTVGLLPVVGIICGGLILGAVTGIALVWISKTRRVPVTG